MAELFLLNPTALRKAKIVFNFGLSECKRVKNIPVYLNYSSFNYCYMLLPNCYYTYTRSITITGIHLYHCYNNGNCNMAVFTFLPVYMYVPCSKHYKI